MTIQEMNLKVSYFIRKVQKIAYMSYWMKETRFCRRFLHFNADISARLESLPAIYRLCVYCENLPTVLHVSS
jgi:hypothetical protein